MSETKINKKVVQENLKSMSIVDDGNELVQDYQYVVDLEKKGIAQTNQEAQRRVDLLIHASNENFAAASTCLGQWHLIGHYVSKDIESAILFFKHAENLGDALAMVELAYIGLKGLSATISNEQGLDYLKKSVDLNHPEAIYASALHILENNPEAALNLLMHNYQQNQHENSLKTCIEHSAFDQNVVNQKLEEIAQHDSYASALLAFQYFQQGNDKKAFHYAQKSQEQNNPYGCYVRALMEEKNPKSDPDVVHEFLIKAAQLGHVDASYWAAAQNLRKADEMNEGAKQQELKQQAFKFFEYAALNHYIPAQYSYAQCLRTGIGTEKNFEHGVQWLERAAQNNNADAQFELAMLIAVEHPQHLALLQAAANNRHVQAMLCMAVHEQQKEQFGQALQWLDLAKDADSARAYYLLAQMYGNGQGVEADPKQRVALLIKAAERGDVDAYFELYQAYSQGLGIRKNKKNAVKYLDLAKQNQHIEACAIELYG
ncbi:sel1 repeat family protein [Acinetobacter sichuanensis]|uniref:tetratricopeptide repeat protein n=1 Tax=Acinetobacter sichuanensis TaxID=2136183 RepID=UPI00280F79BE|nr:sel1 repeat family protein [Acinetobacter sichuanensis]MDQ9020612.1 sel1 repeat family protein [Acinetobacter sichuanensis]